MTNLLRVAVRLSDGSREFPGPLPAAEVLTPDEPPVLRVSYRAQDGTRFLVSSEPMGEELVRRMLADGARNLGAQVLRSLDP